MKVSHLVVDSGAFIKNAPIHEYAENVYTVEGALKEIKDKATRQRLQFLPYKLQIKNPSPEAYRHVLEFSKKTGDFAALSTVDLQIIALTYQLEKENVGTNHLHTEPSKNVTTKPCFVDSQCGGFYYPKKTIKHSESDSSEDSNDTNNKNEETKEDENIILSENIVNNEDDKENEGIVNNEDDKENESIVNNEDDKENESEGIVNDDDNKESEISDTDDDDDEEGWITSANIAEIQKKMGAMVLDAASTVSVACISTDFSIQNILLQIGLHILSVDGMLIKNARVFILRCYACYKTTCDSSKKFCPNCGNKTLKRVAVSYSEQGSQNVHINFKKPINIRGTRYSLPMPKGGKHSMNPILVEDQPIPHNRPPKMALQKYDVLSPDYEALSSPFTRNDVYSRAASLGIGANRTRKMKKNPNEWSTRTGNKNRNK